jgi:hypothetical protein
MGVVPNEPSEGHYTVPITLLGQSAALHRNAAGHDQDALQRRGRKPLTAINSLKKGEAQEHRHLAPWDG